MNIGIAIINNAAVNICLQISLQTFVFVSLGRNHRSGIDGSSDKLTFSFLRNCQTVSQSGCAVLHL